MQASPTAQRPVPSSASGNEVTAYIQQRASELEGDLIQTRRYLHAHPELSGKEVATSDFIARELDNIGIEYRRVTGPRPYPATDGSQEFIGTGIIATIRGEAPGAYDEDGIPAHRIALRADIDALPVGEQTGVDFASQNPGVMHACGHDCHIAMALTAARILFELRKRLRGEVRLLFQPAEEISLGARDLIAAGALEDVDAIFGMHIWSEVPAGTVSAQLGTRMASTDWFRVDIEGLSAHGSMPHKGIDAVVVACEIVTALQVLVSRDTSPFEPVVVTVGEIHGGTARNIMAGSAWFAGTVRTWDRKTRENVSNRLERIVNKMATGFGAQMKFSYEAGNPGLVNDRACALVAADAAEKVLGTNALYQYQGTLAGEDFSEYLQHVPGVFVFLGAQNEKLGAVHPQHSCFYTIDESALKNGVMVTAQWACDMLS